MRETQQTFQHGHQRVAGAAQFSFRAAVHDRLGQLQIPVAELVPGEFIQNARRDIEAEVIQRFTVRFHGLVEFRQDPAIGQRQHFLAAVEAAILLFGVHQHETAGVPQLVAEVAVAFETLHVPVDIATGGGQRRQRKAQGVGAVRLDAFRELLLGALADFLRQLRLHHVAGTFLQQFFQRDAVDHIQRVNHVALGFGHLLAFIVADKTGHIDGFKRHLRLAVFIFDEVHGHHDHAGNPEEDNIEAGDHHAGRVELTQRVGVFRPAEGGERPERGGEPGIQHVVVLAQRDVRGQVIFLTHFLFAAAYIDVAFGIVPGRDTVAPPELTGDTPVLNIAHPGEVHVFVLLRHKLNIAVFYRFHRRFRQHVGTHVPLVGQHRFDNHAAAVAVRHGQIVRFDLFEQAEFIHGRHDRFTRGEALHFLELRRDLV
ncbi:hypothetical protein BN136_3257 [Cronobacter universalis NCTC 9529]|nr:hypothetical protein BN136_3257 [Cronobacter universalis NCTC 9529]